MLTEDQIIEAGRLENQVGEPRPGFLHDEAAALVGPALPRDASPAFGKVHADTGSNEGTSITIEVTMKFEEDPDTGELRLIQKYPSD